MVIDHLHLFGLPLKTKSKGSKGILSFTSFPTNSAHLHNCYSCMSMDMFIHTHTHTRFNYRNVKQYAFPGDIL